MQEILEIGAKLQKTYMDIQSYYETAIEKDGNCLDEDHKSYEYVMLCELIMHDLKKDFPFILDDE